MIDVEMQIYNKVANTLREEYGDKIFITGEYVRSPAKYPAVSIVEMDNTPYLKSEDSGSMEHHVSVMYEVNAYSNLTTGKKMQCKEIIAVIDEVFLSLGFRRRTLTPVPNEEGNGTIYRMLGRYSAVISENEVIYSK